MRNMRVLPAEVYFFLFCWQMRFAQEHIVSCSIPNNWLPARRMRPIIMPVVITLLERKLLMWCWTEFVSWPINVLACKDFWCSIRLVAVLAVALHHCWWNACRSTMERNQSSSFRSIPRHRYTLFFHSIPDLLININNFCSHNFSMNINIDVMNLSAHRHLKQSFRVRKMCPLAICFLFRWGWGEQIKSRVS